MNKYIIKIIDSDKRDEQLDKTPVGYITIEDNKYTYTPLKSFKDSFIGDRESDIAYKLNTDIKAIYDINFPCSIYFLDKSKVASGEKKNLDESNIFVIPRANTASESKIQAYLNARLFGNKPSIDTLDKATIYKIQNSRLVKMNVGDMINEVAKRKGIKLYVEPIKEISPRVATYPVYLYDNYSRKSGVRFYAYNPSKTIIYVYFSGKKHAWYKYDNRSAPQYVISEMIRRARSGWGLNRFINKHPKTYYWKGTWNNGDILRSKEE